MTPTHQELLRALSALALQSDFAYVEARAGRLTALGELGMTMKRVENAVIARRAKRDDVAPEVANYIEKYQIYS